MNELLNACPQRRKHTKAPTSYLGWHDWAARMTAAGRRQKRCPGCGLWAIWTGGRVLPPSREPHCLLGFQPRRRSA